MTLMSFPARAVRILHVQIGALQFFDRVTFPVILLLNLKEKKITGLWMLFEFNTRSHLKKKKHNERK